MAVKKPVLLITASMFFFSLVAILGRFTAATGVQATFASFLIAAGATIVLLKGRTKRVMASEWQPLLLLALAQTGANVFFLNAIRLIDLASAALLLYTAPLWVMLAFLTTRRVKPAAGTLGPLLLGMAGVVLVIGPGALLHLELGTGVLIGLLSGICYAGNFIFGERARKNGTGAIVFWMHLIGSVIVLPFVLFSGLPVLDAPIVGLGLVFAAASFLLYGALRLVEPHHASLIALFEPLFVALWGVLLFGEIPSASTAIGGLLLLAALYLVNRQL